MPEATFRSMPFMGVIRVNEAAMQHGYTMGSPEWSNLGQGQPEVGPLAGAPPRPERVELLPDDHAYGPVEGIAELREAIAAHYNRLYRRGKASQYSAENVVVAAGGRMCLSRLAATFDNMRLGHFTPDYTAYEDLLSVFNRATPVHIALEPSDGFRIAPDDLDQRVISERLNALLISNPCNPTGVVVRGEELAAWIDMARHRKTVLLMDEFYSHFVYTPDGGAPVSAAKYVEDVNDDPVILIDGLTKSFRYPGWRVGWVVAPKAVVRRMTAAGSFLDGGPSRLFAFAELDSLVSFVSHQRQVSW